MTSVTRVNAFQPEMSSGSGLEDYLVYLGQEGSYEQVILDVRWVTRVAHSKCTLVIKNMTSFTTSLPTELESLTLLTFVEPSVQSLTCPSSYRSCNLTLMPTAIW